MVQKKGTIISLILALFCAFRANVAFADMSSANYQIQWDEISAGGGNSSSASYGLRDSVGTQADGSASSSSYSASQGFRAGIYDLTVSFSPYVQDLSTQVAATSATSGPFNEVTVTTTSGYVVGDYVLVVQDEGATQVTAMGQVTSVTATTLGIRSNYAGSVPSIDGTGDYVYEMSSVASMGFGTLASSSVTTHTIGWVATSDVDDGYAVYLFSGGEFASGSDTIPGVSDGAVSVGVSEYGGRSSDSTLATSTFDTQDTAITTSPALVASVDAHPFSSLGFVTLKASISSSQAGGSYTQTLTAVFVGEY